MPFPSNAFLVGSDLAADVQVDGLEPHHAHFTVERSGRIWVRDLSGGQTLVDGRLVAEAEVPVGAKLKLGSFALEVQIADEGQASAPHAHTQVSNARLVRVTDVGQVPGPLAAGSLVAGRYRLERLIAKGGMGEVFEATHVELERVVALKVMLASLSSDPQFVSRFKAEAIAAGRVGNEHIIDVLDSGKTEEDRFFFTMEYLKGCTLTELIDREAPLTPRRVGAIGAQVAQALAAAHREGIVHRDLKPDNVMLVERAGNPEFVKVVDFGVARMGQLGNNTALGTLMGTPLYMAPEQARGQRVDRRADLYSLGLMLHEMLTGEPTFSAENAMRVIDRQLHDPAPTLPKSVPAPLRTLVAKLLEKNENARPQSAVEVAEVLEQVSQARGLGRTLLGWGLGVGGALVVVGATAFALHDGAPVAVPPPDAVPMTAVADERGVPRAEPTVPGRTGPSPEHPGQSPEHPGPSPERPGPLPERPGPLPDHPAQSPERASTVPVEPKATPRPHALPRQATAAASTIATPLEPGDLVMAVGTSKLVHVDGVTRTAIADEHVATVRLVGGEVKVVARQRGETNLLLMTGQGSTFKKLLVK